MTWESEFKRKCYQEVDGYFVWGPDKPINGYLDSGALRQMADWLDEMNRPWDAIVQGDPSIAGVDPKAETTTITRPERDHA